MNSNEPIASKWSFNPSIMLVVIGIMICLIVQFYRLDKVVEPNRYWMGWFRDYKEYSRANRILKDQGIAVAGIEFRGLPEKNFLHHQGISFYLAQNVMTDVVLKVGCRDTKIACLIYSRNLANADFKCADSNLTQKMLSRHVAICRP